MFGYHKKIIFFILCIIINYTSFAESGLWNLLKNETWILADYYDILKSQDRDNLIKKFPKVEELYYTYSDHLEEPIIETWINHYERKFEIIFSYYNEFTYATRYSPDTKILEIGDSLKKMFCISDIYFSNNCFQLKIYSPSDYANVYLNYYIIPFPKFNKNFEYKFNIYFDGDYFDLYLNNKFIHKFCRIDEASLKEYQNLIKDNKCDLSKVTWPRHADGKCDYDDKIIIPDSVKIVEELKKEFSSVKKQKKPEIIKKPIREKGEYSITETTIIRDKAKEASILTTTIAKDSKVVVKKIGRKDTINGIQSNWVEINIVPGAVNKVGRPIHVLTTGWVFGGYLKKEVGNAK